MSLHRIVYINLNAVVVVDVERPSLKPLQINQITNILLPVLIENNVPLMEVLHQLLLHLLLLEQIEHLPEFTHLEISRVHLQPPLNRKLRLLLQLVHHHLAVNEVPALRHP